MAQNIYSIYLYTGLHKRKVFDQIIHIMSKRINLSIYKHQKSHANSQRPLVYWIKRWAIWIDRTRARILGGFGDFKGK